MLFVSSPSSDLEVIVKKVLVIVPFNLDAEGIANRRAQMNEVDLGPGIEFDFRGVKAGPALFDSYHDFALADVALFEAGADAESEGYDAICIDTMSDSGMNALRSALEIPVIGPGKASFLMACMLGHKFSVLTQWDPWKALYSKAAQEYGLTEKLASVRSINKPPDVANLLGGKEEDIFPLLLDAGLKCVEEDGADVICMGSTTMHQSVPYLQENLPVPVVNPGPLTYKLAELVLGLGITHSKTAYPKPHVPKIDMLHALQDGAAAADKMVAS
jgi:allantoin racemase